MDTAKIARINELARKSKETALNEEELAEQKVLRDEYIASYRASLRGMLDGTVIQRPDGSREPLRAKKEKE